MSYNCSTCNREYNSDEEEKYNKHITSNKCKELYECVACDYSTKLKGNYTRHLATKKCAKNTKNYNRKTKNFECEICGLTFRDNHNLQKHLNRKTPCIPISNNTINTSISDNYVYILQDRTSVKLAENIYKIGKSKQANLKRFNSYPKGYKIIMLVECFDCDTVENKLIELFKSKYEQVSEYGREYFKGNVAEMKKDIFLFSL